MRTSWLLIIVAGLAVSQTGCRCFPGFNSYANLIDDVNDHGNAPLFDRMYKPTWDISRAGRADWCSSSINRALCPCRCSEGAWDRYDDCYRYPPSHPYQYPAEFFGIDVTPSSTGSTPQRAPVMAPPKLPGEEIPIKPEDPSPNPDAALGALSNVVRDAGRVTPASHAELPAPTKKHRTYFQRVDFTVAP